MKLVLADDHPIVLEGLAALFRSERDIEIVARCVNGEEALETVTRLAPDLLLLDVHMPKLDGFSVVRELVQRKTETRIILLAAALEREEAVEALRLGVRGVVLKELAPDQLVECVRAVFAGDRWIEPRTRNGVVDSLLHRDDRPAAAALLTPREQELVRMVARGMRNKELALRMNITEGTVKIHLHHVYKKLAVESRLQLVLLAQAQGLV
jgi:DNA-binding NarL/FixJ family response regulator